MGSVPNARGGKAVGTLPKASKSGYSFKGWFTKKSRGPKITLNGATYTAVFTKKNAKEQ